MTVTASQPCDLNHVGKTWYAVSVHVKEYKGRRVKKEINLGADTQGQDSSHLFLGHLLNSLDSRYLESFHNQH